jgi:hypothetical protein
MSATPAGPEPLGPAALDIPQRDSNQPEHVRDERKHASEHWDSDSDCDTDGDDLYYSNDDEGDENDEEYDDTLVKTTINPAASGLSAVNAAPGAKIW